MKTFQIPNFLSDIELLFIEDLKCNPSTYISNNNKKLNLYQIDVPETIRDKISRFGKIIKAEVYELEQPYRIHTDSRNEYTSKYTCIVPLDLEPQGGITIFDQYAKEFSYSLDPYYSSNYNQQLPLSERHIISNWNKNIKLPDTLELSHIRDEDKIGFSIKEQIEFEFNKLVAFPSIHFHCSNNTKNFTSKSSLVMFTV